MTVVSMDVQQGFFQDDDQEGEGVGGGGGELQSTQV